LFKTKQIKTRFHLIFFTSVCFIFFSEWSQDFPVDVAYTAIPPDK